jgi:hypothetical protein
VPPVEGRLRSGPDGTDPSEICEVTCPVRLTLPRDAPCRQGIASPERLDDVRAMGTLGGREMHPDIGWNAQVQVVLSVSPTGVRDDNTRHATGLLATASTV